MTYLLLLLALLASPLAMATDTEEPRWELLTTLDSVEVRHYEQSIQAITPLNSSGTSSGFRRLAGYIFGGNERSQSIAMTAPVQETLGKDSPVMTFTMPAEYAMEDLPEPDDSNITLLPVPARTVAAIRFSGFATDRKTAQKRAELMAMLEQHQIAPLGVPTLNQYNPPWTLPFLRRNEVAVEVKWDDKLATLQ